MKILIAGDYYPGIVEDKDALYRSLEVIRPLCSEADYSVINYESPISSEWDSPIKKCGPCLKSSCEAVQCLKNIGFDCVSLANNHVLDQGKKTLLQTIDVCKNMGFDVVGAGKNLLEARRILYKEIKGKTLAIINCCEHEFSIALEDAPGSNPLNPIQQFYDIREAREKADNVLVIIHGGHEHFQFPSPRMRETYKFFIDAGADVVVNHHQHCYSGYEIHNGKPIFYGLGNFYFPKNETMSLQWYEGFIVEIDFGNTIEFNIHPYMLDPNNNTLRLIDSRKEFDNELNRMNSIIDNSQELKKVHNNWMHSTRKLYESLLLPYTNRYLVALWNRNLFPSLIPKKKFTKFFNYIACESHRDRLLDSLTSKLDS